MCMRAVLVCQNEWWVPQRWTLTVCNSMQYWAIRQNSLIWQFVPLLRYCQLNKINISAHTHTRLTALCQGLPGWAGTRKVKPILDFTEARDGDWQWHHLGKSAPRSRQITTPAPHHSVFYRPGAFPAAQPTTSKHLRQTYRQLYLTTKQLTSFSNQLQTETENPRYRSGQYHVIS